MASYYLCKESRTRSLSFQIELFTNSTSDMIFSRVNIPSAKMSCLLGSYQHTDRPGQSLPLPACMPPDTQRPELQAKWPNDSYSIPQALFSLSSPLNYLIIDLILVTETATCLFFIDFRLLPHQHEAGFVVSGMCLAKKSAFSSPLYR